MLITAYFDISRKQIECVINISISISYNIQITSSVSSILLSFLNLRCGEC